MSDDPIIYIVTDNETFPIYAGLDLKQALEVFTNQVRYEIQKALKGTKQVYAHSQGWQRFYARNYPPGLGDSLDVYFYAMQGNQHVNVSDDIAAEMAKRIMALCQRDRIMYTVTGV